MDSGNSARRVHPVISVVIPAYNEEKLIGRTLAQFTPELMQKFDLELIVSDGGSTDRTLEIASGFPCTILRHTENRKQTIAEGRNAGAAIARGEILFFLNADTIIDDHDVEGFITQTLHALDPADVAAVTCSVYIYPDEATQTDRIVHTLYNWYFYSLNVIGMGMGRGECQIIKRVSYEKVGGNKNHIVAGEDFDLFTRLIKIGKIRYLRTLRVYESPRRYRKYGYARVTASWLRNSVSVYLFNRSTLNEWEAVR
jgi:glycosyltransferase involved in cell wall biosynthesis